MLSKRTLVALAFCCFAFVWARGAAAVVITQSTNPVTITPGSVSCNSGGLHTDNSYYRDFTAQISALGAPAVWKLTNVQIGVETANATAGTQPIVVRAYTYSGSFPASPLVQIGTDINVSVPNQAASLLNIPVVPPIDVTVAQPFVIEIFTPSG